MITWHITIIMLLFLWLTVLQLYFWFTLICMWMISSTYPLKYFQLKIFTTVQAQSVCNLHKDYTNLRRSLVLKRTSQNCPSGNLKGICTVLWKTIPIKPNWSSIHGRLLWRLLDIKRLTETISLNGIFKTVHKLFPCTENSMWISQEVSESMIHLRN